MSTHNMFLCRNKKTISQNHHQLLIPNSTGKKMIYNKISLKIILFVDINLSFFGLQFSSVKNGVFRQYVSGRSEKELIAFIDDKKWKEVEPISKWTTPDSIQSVHYYLSHGVRKCTFLTCTQDAI